MNPKEMFEALCAKLEEFKSMFASSDEKRKALEAKSAELEKNLAQAQADLATAKQTIASVQAEKTALATEIADLKTRNAKLETDLTASKAAQTDFDAKVAAKTREVAAAQGLAIAQLPDNSTAAASQDKLKAQAMETYTKLLQDGKTREAGAFWQENRKLLGS